MANEKEDWGGYVGIVFIVLVVATMVASLFIDITTH
jgi:hypothetical protein